MWKHVEKFKAPELKRKITRYQPFCVWKERIYRSGNLLQTHLCFRNSPICLYEELTGEMKEMKKKDKFHFARHGVLFPKLLWISQGMASGLGSEGAQGLGAARAGRPPGRTRWACVIRGRQTREWSPGSLPLQRLFHRTPSSTGPRIFHSTVHNKVHPYQR